MSTWSVVVLWWRDTWTQARTAIGPLITTTTSVLLKARASITAAWDRHVDKLGSDPAYGRTLVEAVSAVVRTVVTRSTVAAAIVVFLTAVIVPSNEGDDYEPEPHQGSRTWAPRARPLWDTFAEE